MQQNKGPDVEVELEVTLKDLYLGRVIEACVLEFILLVMMKVQMDSTGVVMF